MRHAAGNPRIDTGAVIVVARGLPIGRSRAGAARDSVVGMPAPRLLSPLGESRRGPGLVGCGAEWAQHHISLADVGTRQ
ncbi:hypothetical protein [Nocardia sp. CA-119907]|uniref:hypothetical protein n=1 Tax=Nocardia sp. CA-119907 TaxID=3239973 RepID=UPI003D953AAD